jgi:ribosomal protein L21E
MHELIKHNLNHAKQQMKSQADKNHTAREFAVGDSVFIKLQPYVQSSVARRAHHKLAFKYFGPYTVITRINPTAYEVQLPPESRIHPVFHVSQLRKVLLPGTTANPSLPTITDIIAIPVKLLGHRWRRAPTGRREQVQVQWSTSSTKDITWEDRLDLQQRFPAAPAWGQAETQEGGDVRGPPDSVNIDTDMGVTTTQERPKRIVQPNRRHVGPDWVQ